MNALEEGFDLAQAKLTETEAGELREVIEAFEGTPFYERISHILQNAGLRGRVKIEDIELLRAIMKDELLLWRS